MKSPDSPDMDRYVNVVRGAEYVDTLRDAAANLLFALPLARNHRRVIAAWQMHRPYRGKDKGDRRLYECLVALTKAEEMGFVDD